MRSDSMEKPNNLPICPRHMLIAIPFKNPMRIGLDRKSAITRFPSALITLIAAGAVVALFRLDQYGIAILGPVPAGLPPLRLPRFPSDDIPSLLASAAGLALVLFSSGMLAARSFASKGGYEIDADREFAAFGAANVTSAISQRFAVTGADSRTAVADAAGGRTQVTGLVAAAAMAIVLLFLTGPLQYVPNATLGALLVFASYSLFDIRAIEASMAAPPMQFSR
jgi:MFS superfamily sulfate permease-like transporter